MEIFSKAAALIVAVSIFLPPTVVAQSKPTGPERILFDSANRERKAQGLPPLRWNSSMARVARAHALAMAKHNSLSHQFQGELDLSTRARVAGARFSVIAENVAVGPAAAVIHAQWMKSPPHRRNLLDPELDSIGVAVAERNGQLFAVEDFSRALVSLSPEAQERRVGEQLKSRGLRLLKDREEARRICALGRGYQGSRQPMYLLRYSTTDLDDLPKPLVHKIQTGRYHTAAVGACSSGHEAGFGNFELTVLLYE